MHLCVSILVLILLAGPAFGQTVVAPTSSTAPMDRNAQRQNKVAAAVENAVGTLYEDLSRQQIFGRVTVRDLLIRTDSIDTFMTTLRNADQVGGPRWIDEQTVQVRLVASGPVLAATLVDIAATAKERSPVKPEELIHLMEAWGKRTFSAVGISSTPLAGQSVAVVPHVAGGTTRPVMLPLEAPRWATQIIQADGRSDRAASRLRAARGAEEKALAALREQVNTLAVGDHTLADAAKSDPRIGTAIDRAVHRAKLTRVDYLADGGASVRAALDLADLWREVDAARQSSIPVFSPR